MDLPAMASSKACALHGQSRMPGDSALVRKTSMELVWETCRRRTRRAFRFLVSRILRCGPIPDHVAFIMDGNRRWAEKRKLQRHAGHEFGFLQLKECLKWCLDLGVRVVTVYAFSIENFKRPAAEVETLMKLAADKLDELVDEQGFLQRNGIRIQVLGDLELLPLVVQQAAARAMRISRHHDRAILNICMSYTAREEMLTALREISTGVQDGTLHPTDITEDLISSSMYTAPHSQVDLLVRTSGETRLSDFLLWQTTLAYVSFLPVLWPDFSLLDFAQSILDYQRHHPHLRAARAAHVAAVAALQHHDDLNLNCQQATVAAAAAGTGTECAGYSDRRRAPAPAGHETDVRPAECSPSAHPPAASPAAAAAAPGGGLCAKRCGEDGGDTLGGAAGRRGRQALFLERLDERRRRFMHR